MDLKECKHCKTAFKPKKRRNVFCSVDCVNAGRVKHKQRQCLNCGKMHIPSQVSRKAYDDKHQFSNMFCSRRCAKKNQEWRTSRKIKCTVCGKAMGMGYATRCLPCSTKGRDEWDASIVLALQLLNRRECSRSRSIWDKKIDAMIGCNRHRETGGVLINHHKTRRNKTWIEACSTIMTTLDSICQLQSRCKWMTKIGNKLSNANKRLKKKMQMDRNRHQGKLKRDLNKQDIDAN